MAVRAANLSAQPLIKRLGLSSGAVRASFMFYNTFAEADALAQAVEKLVRQS